jgi:3-hydroxy-9,10-secoandrosta-1,3,5(10)-triene-9,17-dione monooxygenase reductase component
MTIQAQISRTAAADALSFRKAVGAFPTGVALVTAHTPQGPVGMTVNSFSSVSLDPMLVLFCPAKSSRTWPALREAGSCAISILASDQEELSRAFASRREDRFAGFEWESTRRGHPVPVAAAASFEVDLAFIEESRAGDHDIVICAVSDWKCNEDSEPSLVFQRGVYGVPALGRPDGTLNK